MKDLRTTPRSQPWLELVAIVLGWLSWAVTYGWSISGKAEGNFAGFASDMAVMALIGIALTIFLFDVLRLITRRHLVTVPNLVLAALAAFLFGLLAVVASNVFWAIVSGGSIGMPWKNYFLNAMGWYIVFAGFTILYFFFGNWWALQAERERAMRSDTLAREARLQMLRYQLNPHFLFNALGTIRSVLYEDVGRADRLVTELSDFLRYTLVEEDRLEVKLGQELDTIQNYLTIQQMRFEEKLETSICAGEEARAWTIPAFLIHPLVENAIKYGMRTSTLPLRVSVDARVVDGALRVAVVNSGRLVDGRADGLENGAGIGLKNVRLHLEHFFPERHAFTLEERGGEVHAVLTVEPEHEHAG